MPAGDESKIEVVVGRGTEIAATACRAWDAGRAILPVNPGFTRAEVEALLARVQPERPAPADTAAIVVTSGTTGEPKGVELTRTGMDVMARGYCASLDADTNDRWLACLPLHHVASLAVIARAYATGVAWIVHDTFDLDRVACAPSAEGATIVSLVPTTLLRLLDARAPLHEYRRIVVGGAPCPPALRARAERAGATIVDAYGLTETWGGCVLDGTPIAGCELRIADDGEVLVRGAMVMRGYRHGDRAFDGDGWLHSGDVGRVENGRLVVIDRVKDLIITGGVNVSPTEVEGVLMTHPAIVDVCVVGAFDDEWGERVVAYAVVREHLTLADLRDYARAHLSAPKLPRELVITEQIPRSNSGKPLRRVLRDAS